MTALTILIVTVLVRLSKGDEIEIYDVKINLRYLPLIIFGLTLAHLYTGLVFNLYVRELIFLNKLDTAVVFESLRRDGPLFFAGLVARLEIVQGPFGPAFIMDPADPTTILAHVAAIGTFVAMLRWRNVTWRRRIVSGGISAALIISNWFIGGGWAVHASCLSDPGVCTGLIM